MKISSPRLALTLLACWLAAAPLGARPAEPGARPGDSGPAIDPSGGPTQILPTHPLYLNAGLAAP